MVPNYWIPPRRKKKPEPVPGVPAPVYIGGIPWCGRCKKHALGNELGPERIMCPSCLDDLDKQGDQE